MPIFEYKCKKCGHKFEELVSGKEKISCPKCGSENLEKLISNFNSKQKDSSSACSDGTCNIGCPTCRG